MTTRQPLSEDVRTLLGWCDNENPSLGPDEIDALHSLLNFYKSATKTLRLIEALPVKWRRQNSGSPDVPGRHDTDPHLAAAAHACLECAEQLEHIFDPKLWCGGCGMASNGSCLHCGPGGPLVNSTDAERIRSAHQLRDARTWLTNIGTSTLHGPLPVETMNAGLGHLAAMIERVEKLET